MVVLSVQQEMKLLDFLSTHTDYSKKKIKSLFKFHAITLENGKVLNFDDMVKKGDMMTIDDILDILGIELIGVVPDDEDIIISTNRGEPAASDMKSRAGQAYRNIAKRITGEEVPIMDLEESAGFVATLKKIFGMK